MAKKAAMLQEELNAKSTFLKGVAQWVNDTYKEPLPPTGRGFSGPPSSDGGCCGANDPLDKIIHAF